MSSRSKNLPARSLGGSKKPTESGALVTIKRKAVPSPGEDDTLLLSAGNFVGSTAQNGVGGAKKDGGAAAAKKRKAVPGSREDTSHLSVGKLRAGEKKRGVGGARRAGGSAVGKGKKTGRRSGEDDALLLVGSLEAGTKQKEVGGARKGGGGTAKRKSGSGDSEAKYDSDGSIGTGGINHSRTTCCFAFLAKNAKKLKTNLNKIKEEPTKRHFCESA